MRVRMRKGGHAGALLCVVIFHEFVHGAVSAGQRQLSQFTSLEGAQIDSLTVGTEVVGPDGQLYLIQSVPAPPPGPLSAPASPPASPRGPASPPASPRGPTAPPSEPPSAPATPPTSSDIRVKPLAAPGTPSAPPVSPSGPAAPPASPSIPAAGEAAPSVPAAPPVSPSEPAAPESPPSVPAAAEEAPPSSPPISPPAPTSPPTVPAAAEEAPPSSPPISPPAPSTPPAQECPPGGLFEFIQSLIPDFANSLKGSSAEQDLSDPEFVGTVFIPLNASLLPPNLTPEAKQRVIQYHVVPGEALTSSQLSDGQVLSTLLPDEDITVSKPSPESPLVLVTNDGGPSVAVESADGLVCKAVVHIIRSVLVPRSVGTVKKPPESPP